MTYTESRHIHLPDIAECHIAAFPKSFSSQLGKNYVTKMLEWYISTNKSFLFHLEEEKNIIGYCGGIIVDGTLQTGAASGMTQHSFYDALKALAFRPWLLFHPEILNRYPFLLKNIKTKLGLYKPERPTIEKEKLKAEPHIGLVVIGVNPLFHGKGYGSLLLKAFEEKALKYGIKKLQLTVKCNNEKAIRAYKKNGWKIENKNEESCSMLKYLSKTKPIQ